MDSMFTNSIPGHENRETNTTRLTLILNDPALRLLFREFLRETLCEENLSFWLDVREFGLTFRALSDKTLDNIRETLAAAYGKREESRKQKEITSLVKLTEIQEYTMPS